ncbi:flagellar hook-length control protein FliK [Scleromatobacter humisilvae]|uniref:Flagellar hook-length control protein FliK n=1 Tax=Scleromatobacter humisilvae TaxID=2897159 RepID=A0A9X1YH06_9BURK|nr:flagellar hook-length control protein FliK [Scleromatobacter humisilvae]MCK9684685.1 flagellar hook-length control protein FliK [Scleromatobacter humisilvae]
MTLPTGNHPRVHSSTHASHASHAHAAHAASKAKASLAAEEGEGGGFAAQLLKAQPAAGKDLKAADAKPKAEAARKPTDDKDGQASADANDAKDGKDDKDAKAEARPALDPAALLAQQQQQPIAPPTTSLADKTAAADDHDDFATDPLGALRKAASAKAGKDDGKAALMAGLGAGKQPAGSAGAAATGVGAKGATTGEITAALAKADEAVKAATDARDALAAMLPQPDPMAVQAGAVGAPSNALMDANQGAQQASQTPPAQATLPMPPQAPAFAPALGHQIDVWMKGGVQHAEVQLSPQDLGPIRVKIEMQGDQTRVHMSADVQSTRDALQQAMPQLSQQLGQVGISLTGGGVSDQPTFQQSQAQAQANAGGFGGGRSGNGGSQEAGQGGLEEIAAASAARQMAQRRGLLDTYA